MATSLSTTLSPNNLLHPNTNTNLTSTRVLSYQTLKPHPNKTFSLSTQQQCHLVPSAVSGSPGNSSTTSAFRENCCVQLFKCMFSVFKYTFSLRSVSKKYKYVTRTMFSNGHLMCIQVPYIYIYFHWNWKTQLTKISISGIETSEASEDNSTLLDTAKVFDLNGNGIPISQLWKDRKAVVAFARHFG